jgi:hypothetical protein
MCSTAERRREIERQLSQVKIAHPEQVIAGHRVGRSEFFFWVDGVPQVTVNDQDVVDLLMGEPQ